MTETRAARATDLGLVPGEKGEGSRKKGEPGQGGQTDVETRAARAMAEARQAGMEERSREKQDRGTVGQRDPNCAGHGLGLGPWVEEGRRR